MSKKNQFFVLRDEQVSGPFLLPSIRKQVQDGAVGGDDHIGRTESGPWKLVQAVPSLEEVIPVEAMGDEWDEQLVESEAYSPAVHRKPPQFEPVSEPVRPIFLWGIGGALAVLIVGAVVGGFYLATGDRSGGQPAEVSAFDSRTLRARAEWISETAFSLSSIQTWLNTTEPSGPDGSATIAGDAEVPGLNEHLAALIQISGTATAEPDVGRECQRLINILGEYQLRQNKLVTAVAEFTAAAPTAIPYDTLETTIGECRELGVPILKARADRMAEVVATSRNEDSMLAELVAMEEFDFQTAISQRPVVSGGTKSELLALAKFFAIQGAKDAAVSARGKIIRQQADAMRIRNRESTADKALYLVGTESYEELDQRHGSFTVVRWHGQSPTYFVPSKSGDPQEFRKMASTLGLLIEPSSENALEVRLPLDMLSRLKKWLDARQLEQDAADKDGEQEGQFLASTNVKRVLARLWKQVYVGFGDSERDDSYTWSSLMCAGTLGMSSSNGQEVVFLDVERVIVTRSPCRATALANRAAIAVSGHVVTREREFDVPLMDDVVVSPIAMATLGLEASHLVPPTEERAGVLREEYMELIVRGDENQIRQTNKTIRGWFRAAIDQRNLVLPEQNALEERIGSIVNSDKKSQLTRWARILRLGSGMRLYDRSTNILGGSSRIQEDIAAAAFSDDSLRRAVPASVVGLFEDQILQPRVVLAVSSDGVWIVTGKEAVNAVRKLFDIVGFNGDQKQEKLALSQASAFYSNYTPAIRRPVIPPPPSDPLYPRKGPMPRPPRGGSKTTTATVVSVPRAQTGDASLDSVLNRGAMDGAMAAAKLGDSRLLRAFGGSTRSVVVRNKNYAGDAAWARYRRNVQLVEERYRTAISTHRERVASGAYNSNPVWIRYQSELSSWNKKKDEKIAAWTKQSAELLAAWRGGRKRSVLKTITELRISRREQLAQIQRAAEALRSGSGQPKSSVSTEPMPKRPVQLVPSLVELLAR